MAYCPGCQRYPQGELMWVKGTIETTSTSSLETPRSSKSQPKSRHGRAIQTVHAIPGIVTNTLRNALSRRSFKAIQDKPGQQLHVLSYKLSASPSMLHRETTAHTVNKLVLLPNPSREGFCCCRVVLVDPLPSPLVHVVLAGYTECVECTVYFW